MLASDSPPEDVCRRIQVSREKKPLNFFVTLSKKFLQTDQVVELSGLGLAVTTVVTIAEILKSNGLVQLEGIFFSFFFLVFAKQSNTQSSNSQLFLPPRIIFTIAATEIRTSLVEGHSGGRSAAPKAKIQIWIRRTDNFDQLIASQLGTRSPRPEPLATAPVQEAGDTNPPVHPPVHPAP